VAVASAGLYASLHLTQNSSHQFTITVCFRSITSKLPDLLPRFSPRDAMLTCVLAMALRLPVCLSQNGVLSEGMNGSIFLECRLHSTSSTLSFKKIQVSTKIRLLPSGTSFLIRGLGKFRHGISIDERAST